MPNTKNHDAATEQSVLCLVEKLRQLPADKQKDAVGRFLEKMAEAAPESEAMAYYGAKKKMEEY